MAEPLPLYGPGYSISVDRYGNLVDMAASLIERFCLLGQAWRIDTGYVTLALTGDYTLVTFTTPATGRVFYTFAELDKSGAEVTKSLIRGGTVTGGVAGAGYNYNDDVTAACPATGILLGGTISGGVEHFISMAPGDANPASKPGGTSRAQGLITLRQSTQYTLKLTAVGGAATLAANVGFAYIPTA